MQTNIIGVRFTKIGKIYHFDSAALPDVKQGEHVIVDTARGKHLGEVVQILEETPPQPEGGWKSVERRATPRDLLLQQSWQARQTEAMINCRAHASELHLKDVKIVTAEYNYDGSRLAFLFSAESEDKVDLKSLKKDMSQLYPATHVEMRQIGPRDVAKFLGGMGACGIETRCCSQFLTDFSPISIKMAKEQGISLTPNEITGMCGRLRCCLIYEYEQYVEARKTLPKRNKRVVTPKGEGKVVDVIPMSDKVVVLIESGTDRPQHITFSREEIEPWDELEALKRKSQSPCDRHEGGGCTLWAKRKNRKSIIRYSGMQTEQRIMEQPDNWSPPQNILVILAHPDDPEFFCGGTLARWARAGHQITYLLLTCGDKGYNPATHPEMTPENLCGLRHVEQNNAAKIIGATAVHFLDFEDGYLVPSLDLRRDIVREIRRHKPDILVTCDPQNLFALYGINHPDHRACGQAVIDAVFPAANNVAYFPELLEEGHQPHMPKEVWCSLTNQPNTIIDVTDTWNTKLNAILEHKTQVQDAKKLTERLKSRRTEDSTNENPRYEEKFRVVKYT